MASDRHDALVRVIACRLPACSEAELVLLDQALVVLEQSRDPVERGLSELRDAPAMAFCRRCWGDGFTGCHCL